MVTHSWNGSKTMKAVLHDLADETSSLHGARVHDEDDLRQLLDSARGREPFVCELAGENGYTLTLGIGPDFGFVQQSPCDGNTPYLVAVAPERCQPHEQEYFEFLAGGTPTPVAARFCLPLETVKEIAACFLATGKRSPAVSWDEV